MSLPDPDKDFIFQGVDGVECEDFVFWVTRRAKKEGRMDNDQWVADLAMTCMARGAMRWYVQLEPEVQNNWKLLRRALMERYPAPDEGTAHGTSILIANPTLPTPAAAPPVASQLNHTSSIQTTAIGYIKLIARGDPTSSGYLSGVYHRNSGLEITYDKTEAVKVSFKRRDDGHFTATSMSSQYTRFEFNGYNRPPSFYCLVLLDESPGGGTCEIPLSGRTMKTLWDLSNGDPRTILVMDDSGSKPTNMTLLLQTRSGLLEWVADLPAFRARGWGKEDYPQYDMELEAAA